MRALLLMIVIATSGFGIFAVLKYFAAKNDWSKFVPAALAFSAWVFLWAGIGVQHFEFNHPQMDSCVSGSEVDEHLSRPVLVVRTALLGDYIRVDASNPNAIRITRQNGGDYATLDTKSGKASTMGTGAIWLCERSPR